MSQCPHPQCSVTVSPSSPPIASLSCQAARWGRCGPAAPEYLLSKLPPLQYLDISQNNFYVYVNNIYFCLVFTYRAARSEPGPGPGQPGRVPELPLSPPAGGFRGQILIILVRGGVGHASCNMLAESWSRGGAMLGC